MRVNLFAGTSMHSQCESSKERTACEIQASAEVVDEGLEIVKTHRFETALLSENRDSMPCNLRLEHVALVLTRVDKRESPARGVCRVKRMLLV